MTRRTPLQHCIVITFVLKYPDGKGRIGSGKRVGSKEIVGVHAAMATTGKWLLNNTICKHLP